MGEFRWTGFDYIGESGGWPRVLGNFGIIDLCNFPRTTTISIRASGPTNRWSTSSRTGPGRARKARTIPVWCYTNCDEAELFLNGKSLGTRAFDAKNDMHLEWLVPYQPGELKVVARKGGKVVATMSHRTAGAPVKLSISSDQTKLDPAQRDLAYVTIRVEDENGNFAPKAAKWVNIQIEGPGRLVGSGPVIRSATRPSRPTPSKPSTDSASPSSPPPPDPNRKSNPAAPASPVRSSSRSIAKAWNRWKLRLIRTGDGKIKPVPAETPEPAPQPAVPRKSARQRGRSRWTAERERVRIQADPGIGSVATLPGRTSDNGWFRSPVTTHRWSLFSNPQTP
jgi:hypothetical protein